MSEISALVSSADKKAQRVINVCVGLQKEWKYNYYSEINDVKISSPDTATVVSTDQKPKQRRLFLLINVNPRNLESRPD